MRATGMYGVICIAMFGVMGVSPLAMGAPGDLVPFDDNDSIEQIEAKIQQNGYQFTVKPNWITQMSKEDKARFFSRRPSLDKSGIPGRDDIGPLGKMLGAPPTESYFSWLDYGGHSYIGPVRNQGSCGSCYAFGAAAAAEGAYNMKFGLVDNQCLDLSEAFIAFCLGRMDAYTEHFSGCGGADYDYYELEALVQEGACLEDEFPYTDSDPGECLHYQAGRVRIAAWHRVPCRDIDAIKTAIRNFGVVDAAVLVTSAFEGYSGGIYEDTNTDCPDCEYTVSNHAIALVGWDDNPPEGGGGCWILRNSWGTDQWGEDGYMRIRYNAAGVSCAVTYAVVDNIPASPPVAATGNPAEVLSSSVKLSGSAIPNGAATSCYFEYGLTTAYGSVTPTVSLGADFALHPIEAPLTGLAVFKEYHCRLVATNAYGTIVGLDKHFKTLPDHPVLGSAVTKLPEPVFQTQAYFRGTFTANYSPATCHFEYGPSKTYGLQTPAFTMSGEVAADDGPWPVEVIGFAEDMLPGTRYHLRLVVENEAGTSYGNDQSFVTYPDGVYLQEDFERGGAIPRGWSLQTLSGTANWSFACGSVWGFPFWSLSGGYNATIASDNYADNRVRLISKNFDVSDAESPILYFGLAMRQWGGDQDILHVYWRKSPQSAWTLLKSFYDNVPTWTPVVIELPKDGGEQCAIAFEGVPKYGYGICIDDVAVGEALEIFRITSQPAGGWYEVGNRLSLSVAAAAASGQVTYQWFMNDESIPEANRSTFEIASLKLEDAGRYYCQISDDSKSILTSATAVVQVFPDAELPLTGFSVGMIGTLLAIAATRRIKRR